MVTKQQKEALYYFKQKAKEWQKKSVSESMYEVNIIRQRNGYALHVIDNKDNIRSAIDVGCGTGDLVCDIALRDITAVGVDFAEEMIKVAQNNAIKRKVANANFYCTSIFDFEFAQKEYDIISANGFIEYISLNDMNKFLDISHNALSTHGSLILSSRNRLFNIVSLNRYTINEIENKTVDYLLKESIALASGRDIDKLTDMETAPFQDVKMRHGNTGIDVSTRYQYTPVQLAKILKKKGFNIMDIYPVHIHVVDPTFRNQNPKIHTDISNLLQNFGYDYPSLVPYASSFMLHAQKGDY
jgi:2-polyprenyl-3-methyl-5-hydroxy-6-metoxy-1,4-benzoquinol methylase